MAAANTTRQSASPLSMPFRWLFALYALIELPLCFMGYGSDEDTYGVLQSGRLTWHDHILSTSRNPGYWVYEAIVYWLNRIGGSVAVDLGAFLVGAFLLWRIERWRHRFPSAAVAVAGFAFLLVPVFQFAASSGDDYLWSLACIVLAVEAFLDEGYLRGALWAALAIAIRAGNSIVLAGIYAGLLWGLWRVKQGDDRSKLLLRVVGCGVLTVVLGLLPYTLSYHLAHSLKFVQPMMGDASLWTPKMRIGKFVYKLLYMFGPIASLVLFVGVLASFRRFTFRREEHIAASICIGAVLANLYMFFKFPLEISYVLPGAYFLLLLFSLSIFKHNRIFDTAFLAAIVLFSLFSFDLAKPNVPGKATGAKIGFSPHASSLVGDIRERWPLRHCASHDCWALEQQAHQAEGK